MSKQVTKKEEAGLPVDYASMLLEDSEQFKEHYSAADVAIPFLRILQGNSPQLKPGGQDYIEGAQQGMWFNTATKQVYSPKNPPLVVKITYTREFVEWVLKEEGGGYVATYAPAEAADALTQRDGSRDIVQDGSPIGKPGNQLQETFTYTCMLLDQENQIAAPAMLSFASTMMKIAKQWNVAHSNRRITLNGRAVQPPVFWDVYELGTAIESNDVNSWYVPVVKHVGELPKDFGDFGLEAYKLARELRETYKENNAPSYADSSEAKQAAPAEGGDTATTITDDEIPF